MYSRVMLALVIALVGFVPATASDGWYRFPVELEGNWKMSDARTGGHTRDDYVGGSVRIDGSTILLRSDKAANVYQLTFVDARQSPIQLDLTATRGTQSKTFRCLLVVSENQIKLVRPQNESHSRPRDAESPDRSETVFTLTRDTAERGDGAALR